MKGIITVDTDGYLATPAEIRLSEQKERGRVRLFERTHGFPLAEAHAMNRRQFDDELQDAEAEAEMAAVVHDGVPQAT